MCSHTFAPAIGANNNVSPCLQAVFNFCSCSAVAAATMNAGGNALLSTGLVMAAHMVSMPQRDHLDIFQFAKNDEGSV